ncbi:MAG: hypothetical protein PF637_02790 [Spirochaetes bacterium]|jgi:hypothetical protein|nr:hypothetical protein [Spirochaetota bacterium]
MKKSYLILLVCALTISFTADAVLKHQKIQSVVATGVYVPKDFVNKSALAKLPVPASYEDYAVLQSIGQATNVILGHFTEGTRRITLITDSDNDGKVDSIFHYFTDEKNYHVITNPEELYTPDSFKKLKLTIIKGSQKDISPNKEGSDFFKSLIEHNSEMITVSRHKRGYQINLLDPDDPGLVRASLSCSNNGVNGTDMAIIVNYRHHGKSLVKPVIPYGVYCKNSNDPLLQETVKEMLTFIQKNHPTL